MSGRLGSSAPGLGASPARSISRTGPVVAVLGTVEPVGEELVGSPPRKALWVVAVGSESELLWSQRDSSRAKTSITPTSTHGHFLRLRALRRSGTAGESRPWLELGPVSMVGCPPREKSDFSIS